MTLAAAFIAAYVAVLSVVLGVVALVLVANLTAATWFEPLRSRAKTVIATLPVLALFGALAVILVIVVDRSTVVAATGGRSTYLAPWFVIVRAVVYWLVWLLIARSIRGAGATHRPRQLTSALGLVGLGFTMSFASIDWMMSLANDWQSTIYGIYWIAGGLVGAIALISVVATRTAVGDDLPPLSAENWQSLGKLMLTFVMFWVYAGFSQYIVIWSGDVPREVGWYVARTRGIWGFTALSMLVVGGALPFLALLQSSVRRSPLWLAGIGVVFLAIHFLESCWLVMPGLGAFEWWTPFLLVAALIVVAGPPLMLARLMRPG